jgi:hypothetical protein
MSQFRAWFSRVLGLFCKKRRDAEMTDEMQHHLELLIERNIAAGLSPDQARNAALRQFGGLEQAKEIAREQRVWRWADEFLQDLHFGARMLLRNPGFSALAILCLTLGIGTTAAVFSWIRRNTRQALPARRAAGPDVRAQRHDPRCAGLHCTFLSTSSIYKARRCSSRSSSIESRAQRSSVGDRAERATGGIVSANYFDALGVRPILGRGFRGEREAAAETRTLSR